MADEKSIYEGWSEERLDPSFPKEWGLDEEDEAELLWPIWPLLFMGESDTEQYVEIITDNVLEEEGVIARQNFTCCGTCASAEIWDEIDDSREWKGYIYFHQQDTESLAESGGTYVGFGSFLAYPKDENEWKALNEAQKEEIRTLHETLSVELMKDTVIPVLEKHGLSVKWKGNFDTRPFIGGVEVYNIP